eukprot:6043165-Pleurochrysis_carterae.AAC.2
MAEGGPAEADWLLACIDTAEHQLQSNEGCKSSPGACSVRRRRRARSSPVAWMAWADTPSRRNPQRSPGWSHRSGPQTWRRHSPAWRPPRGARGGTG